MSDAEITAILHDHAESDILHAILHRLRDKHADLTDAGHEPPTRIQQEGVLLASTAPSAAEWRAHHAGAALLAKEMFFEFYNANSLDQPKD
jgi:hypothetical protein